jgi:putative transposase
MACVHHSDKSSQYFSIRYSERLAEASIGPSVGNKGDSYDNALAETTNGFYEALLIHAVRLEKRVKLSNWPRCKGYLGSTSIVCLNRLAT